MNTVSIFLRLLVLIIAVDIALGISVGQVEQIFREEVLSEASASFSGDMTYYDATGAGNCMFDATGSTNTISVAALNNAQYGTAAEHCGRCARISGAKGSTIVKIVDKCPECGYGALDVSKHAFGKVDDLIKGRVNIAWDFVPCETRGNMQYKMKEGSNQWWVALQVRNHRIGVRRVEVNQSGKWIELSRLGYNYFIQSFPTGIKTPFRIRITAVDGQVVVDRINSYVAGGVVTGSQQFK